MSFEKYKTRDPIQVSASDTAGASFDLAQQDTATLLAARYSSMNEMSKGQMLTPEQANERYPGMPQPWKEPVSANVAQMLSDRNTEKRQLTDMIEKGPQDFYTRSKNFGAGILAHAMDLPELGVGMLAGWGVGALVTKTAWGAATSAAIGKGTAAMAPRLAFHAIEGVAGNAIQAGALEVANQAMQKKENLPTDPYEGAQNVIINTFFGSLFHVGIKEFSFGMKQGYLRFLKHTSPEADLALARGVVSQVERGVRPNPELMIEAIAKETDVKSEFVHEPIDTSRPVPQDKKFYVATDPLNQFDPAKTRPIGEDFGGGVTMTDNPNMSNAAAARSMADQTGQVWEVSAKNLRPLDLNKSLPKNAEPAFREATNELFTDREHMRLSPREKMLRLLEAIDQGDIPRERLTKLQTDLQRLGFNAFLDNGSTVFGHEHSLHNALTVFDHSILEAKKATPADPAIRNDIAPEVAQKEIARQADPKEALGFNKDALEAIDHSIEDIDATGKASPDNTDFITEKLDAQREHLEALDSQGLLDAADKQELEVIRSIEKDPEVFKRVARALGGCLLKHG